MNRNLGSRPNPVFWIKVAAELHWNRKDPAVGAFGGNVPSQVGGGAEVAESLAGIPPACCGSVRYAVSGRLGSGVSGATAYAGTNQPVSGSPYRIVFPVRLDIQNEDCQIAADVRSVPTGAGLTMSVSGDPGTGENANNGLTYQIYSASNILEYAGTVAPYGEFATLGWTKQ